jgi:hypothetical protein
MRTLAIRRRRVKRLARGVYAVIVDGRVLVWAESVLDPNLIWAPVFYIGLDGVLIERQRDRLGNDRWYGLDVDERLLRRNDRLDADWHGRLQCRNAWALGGRWLLMGQWVLGLPRIEHRREGPGSFGVVVAHFLRLLISGHPVSKVPPYIVDPDQGCPIRLIIDTGCDLGLGLAFWRHAEDVSDVSESGMGWGIGLEYTCVDSGT